MAALNPILSKVVVHQFYRQNAGFFLVVFFLAFGIQQPTTLLISPNFLSGAIASLWFVAGILSLFTLYYLKCFNFISKTLALPENEFLYVAGLFSRPHLGLAFARVHWQLFLPALAYTSLMGFYGFITGYLLVLLTVVLYNLIALVFTAYFFSQQIRKTLRATPPPNFFTHTERKILANPVWWPLRHLFRQEKVMLVLTKILSVGILYAFMVLYPYQIYSMRPTQVGFLIAVIAHCMLFRQIVVFNETSLAFLRQLPLKLYQRFLRQVLLSAVLLSPEIILVLKFTFYVAALLPLLSLVGFGLSLFTLFLALLYAFNLRQEPYIKTVFFLFIGFTLLLLLSPPLYLVAGFVLGVALLLFHQNYYHFEPPQD